MEENTEDINSYNELYNLNNNNKKSKMSNNEELIDKNVGENKDKI